MWLPEHWLMPIRFAGSGHVLSSKSAADHRMIVMLYTPTAQLDVIETCSISCLEHKHWRTLLLKFMMQSDPVQFLWKMNQPFFRIFLTCLLNTISVVLKDLLFVQFLFFLFLHEKPSALRTTQMLERAWSSALTRYPPKSESTSSPADLASSTLVSKPTAATMWSVLI